MKKITLAVLIFFTLSDLVKGQANLFVAAPVGGASTELRSPNGTVDHTTLRHVQLIRASELTT
jgi:hypothetical protein